MDMHPNAIKLNSSFVPTWTHKAGLEDEGQTALQEAISQKEFVQDGVLKSYYVEAFTDSDVVKAARVAALLAKHLRLAGPNLVYCTLAGFMREQRIANMEREVESEIPVLTTRGKGYIVIPDFFSNTKVSPGEQWSYRDTEEVGDRLMRHVYAGGGLVLCGRSRFSEYLQDFGIELYDAIMNRFSVVTVRHV